MKVYRYTNFSRLAAVCLSLLQLILGLGLMALQAAGIYFGTISTHLGCSGIWGGFFITFAGISGLVAAKARTGGAICFYMVLCTLSTLIPAAVVVTSTISIMEQKTDCGYTPNSVSNSCPENFELLLVIDMSLIFVSIADYIFSCVALVITCWSICCDPRVYAADERLHKISDTGSYDETTDEIIKGSTSADSFNGSFEDGSRKSEERISVIIEEEIQGPVEANRVVEHHSYQNQAFINDVLSHDTAADEIQEESPQQNRRVAFKESDDDDDNGDDNEDESDKDEHDYVNKEVIINTLDEEEGAAKDRHSYVNKEVIIKTLDDDKEEANKDRHSYVNKRVIIKTLDDNDSDDEVPVQNRSSRTSGSFATTIHSDPGTSITPGDKTRSSGKYANSFNHSDDSFRSQVEPA